MKKRKYSISKFICTQCGSEIYLPRTKNKQREKDHLKIIYCIKCKERVNHREVRETDFEGTLNLD